MENRQFGNKPIDELLGSEAQQMVRATVQALPEDVPSMAWRGALNERITRETARRRSRRRIWWVASPSFGIAIAAVLCVFVFLPGHPKPAPANSTPPAVTLEDQLFASHADSVTSGDVLGSGLTSHEAQQSGDDGSTEDSPSS